MNRIMYFTLIILSIIDTTFAIKTTLIYKAPWGVEKGQYHWEECEYMPCDYYQTPSAFCIYNDKLYIADDKFINGSIKSRIQIVNIKNGNVEKIIDYNSSMGYAYSLLIDNNARIIVSAELRKLWIYENQIDTWKSISNDVSFITFFYETGRKNKLIQSHGYKLFDSLYNELNFDSLSFYEPTISKKEGMLVFSKEKAVIAYFFNPKTKLQVRHMLKTWYGSTKINDSTKIFEFPDTLRDFAGNKLTNSNMNLLGVDKQFKTYWTNTLQGNITVFFIFNKMGSLEHFFVQPEFSGKGMVPSSRARFISKDGRIFWMYSNKKEGIEIREYLYQKK